MRRRFLQSLHMRSNAMNYFTPAQNILTVATCAQKVPTVFAHAQWVPVAFLICAECFNGCSTCAEGSYGLCTCAVSTCHVLHMCSRFLRYLNMGRRSLISTKFFNNLFRSPFCQKKNNNNKNNKLKIKIFFKNVSLVEIRSDLTA